MRGWENATARVGSAPPPPWSRRDVALLVGVVVLATALRLLRLDYTTALVSDEGWYARDGCFYWTADPDGCGLSGWTAPDRDVAEMLSRHGELTPEHPPLGKWLIGAPIEALGMGPRAWRLSAALAGGATVGLLFALARQLLASAGAGLAAAVLLAVDYVHFAYSRLAMLEVFLACFATAAVLFAALDADEVRRRAAVSSAHRRWRYAAGGAAGAAAACKASGVAVLLAVWAIVWLAEATERRRGRGPSSGGAVGSLLRDAVPLLAIPALVYVSTFVGRVDGDLLVAPWSDGAWLRALVERQSLILEAHAAKPATSPSPLWALPMTEPPLTLLLERDAGAVRQLLVFGNPVVWWGGFAALLLAVWAWLRGESRAAPVVVLGFLAGLAGWLSLTLGHRQVHLYHAAPVVPFVCLAAVYGWASVVRGPRARRAAAVALVAAVGAFAFFYPILAAEPLSEDEWRWRACPAMALWLAPEADCGLGSG